MIKHLPLLFPNVWPTFMCSLRLRRSRSIWKQFNAPHLHGEFLNASRAILGNASHSWICPTWQKELWPSSPTWSFYSQSHKTKEFHICNNEQAQQKQRIYSSTLRLEKLCNDNKYVQGLDVAFFFAVFDLVVFSSN